MKIRKRTILFAALPIVSGMSILAAISCGNNLGEVNPPAETNPNPVTPTPETPAPTPEPNPQNPTPGNPGNTTPPNQPGGPGTNSGTPPSETNPSFGDNDPGFNPYDGFVTPKTEPTFNSDVTAISSRIENFTTPNYNGMGIVETGDAAKFITVNSEQYQNVKNDQYETLKDYYFKVEIDRNEKQDGREELKFEAGTAWVLDYIKPSDDTYPLTWFFGTNLHVIINMDFSENATYAKANKLEFRFRDLTGNTDDKKILLF
ncbi:DUF31 family putative serine protease [Mycoplasma testudineum]|uniref:DUF31 family putative serine protease n=1 Tax=Mycoplasma testudineum TaxID=244584 RepID=UPI000B9432E5|nr:hypothetical protein [Mycoplasma testudineum]OYD26505.1 hypothetical protein CG473_03625 [Mycoplasma testudineum]